MNPKTNPLLIKPLVNWLNCNLKEKKIISVLSDNTLYAFVFSHGISIYFNPKSEYSFLVIRDDHPEWDPTSWEHFIRGLVVSGVEQAGNDRIIIFRLVRRTTFSSREINLIFELFGSRGNLVITKSDNTVIFSLRSFAKRNLGIGEKYAPPSQNLFDIFSLNKDKFEKLHGEKDKIINELTGKEFNLPYYIADELVRRAEKKDFYNEYNKLMEIVSQGSEGITIVGDQVLPFRYSGECQSIWYEDFIEGASNYFWQKWESQIKQRRFSKAIRAVKRKIERLTFDLESIRKSIAPQIEPETYRLWGNLILMNKSAIPKGASEIEFEDPSSGEKVKVPLQPGKEPQDVAGMYFKLAKKIERRTEYARKIIGEKERELRQLQKLETELKEGKHIELVEIMPRKLSGEKREKHPFREYRTSSGKLILVGKSDSSNDLLTFKYAHPEDIWFHIDGARGAHVILRADRTITLDDIKTSASIAAYYSDLRNDAFATVIYTERKNLRKPKNSPAGKVIVLNAKKITVKPCLPQKNPDSTECL